MNLGRPIEMLDAKAERDPLHHEPRHGGLGEAWQLGEQLGVPGNWQDANSEFGDWSLCMGICDSGCLHEDIRIWPASVAR